MTDNQSMLPENPRFHIRPKQILSAVEALPEQKGKNRKPRVMLSKLREKLLQISISDVSNWRLKPSILTMLPYLAAEQDNEALLERVIALTLGSMKEMPEGILIRLLPFTIHSKRIRKAAFERFRHTPPGNKAPKWLIDYWEVMLRPEPPANAIAQRLISKKVPIAKALKTIELDGCTPFADALISRMWIKMEPKLLREQPFEDSLKFIASSGQSLSVRRMFMTWMLNTYSVHVHTLSEIDVDTPQREIFLTALQVFGPPDRSHWRQCKDAILPWARHIHHDRLLVEHLDPNHGWGRAAFWRRYVSSVREIHRHTPSSIAIIDLGEVIAVENTNKPKQCALFQRCDFMPIWRKNRWNGRPFRLPQPIYSLVRSQGWQSDMKNALETTHQINGKDWS